MNAMPRDGEIPMGRLAAVDFGTKRIGVAITDIARSIASPLCGYVRISAQQDADWFRRLVMQEDIAQFVIGLPVHMSGEESEKSQLARDFGEWLHAATGVPIVFHDERYSTQQADAWMFQAGFTKKQQRARRDMLAAQAILRSYLITTEPLRPPSSLDDREPS